MYHLRKHDCFWCSFKWIFPSYFSTASYEVLLPSKCFQQLFSFWNFILLVAVFFGHLSYQRFPCRLTLLYFLSFWNTAGALAINALRISMLSKTVTYSWSGFFIFGLFNLYLAYVFVLLVIFAQYLLWRSVLLLRKLVLEKSTY